MAIRPVDREPLDRFPSNSHRNRDEKKEPKKVEKIVTGKVATRKKSLGKRFMETFVGDDIGNVSFYVIHDVLIPAAKSTLSDVVKGAIEMVLFPDQKGSRTSRERGRSYVSYDKQRHTNNRRDDRPEVSPKNRARHNFDEVVLDSRGEAEEVLSHLVDLIVDYGQASVSDLYDLVGIQDNFTDRKWGWVDLSGASASIARGGGYVLNLPKTVLLD